MVLYVQISNLTMTNTVPQCSHVLPFISMICHIVILDHSGRTLCTVHVTWMIAASTAGKHIPLWFIHYKILIRVSWRSKRSIPAQKLSIFSIPPWQLHVWPWSTLYNFSPSPPAHISPTVRINHQLLIDPKTRLYEHRREMSILSKLLVRGSILFRPWYSYNRSWGEIVCKNAFIHARMATLLRL